MQAFDTPLHAGDLEKGGLIFGGDFQRLDQELGELSGGPALARFHFHNGRYTATGALRQLLLSQIKLLATTFESFIEIQGQALLDGGKLVAASSVFISLIWFLHNIQVAIYFIVRISA